MLVSSRGLDFTRLTYQDSHVEDGHDSCLQIRFWDVADLALEILLAVLYKRRVHLLTKLDQVRPIYVLLEL